MANPRGQQRDKPYRDAIRLEEKLAEKGEESPALPGSLRHIARQLLLRASTETQAAKEVGDRLDGKVAQAIIGDAEADPVKITTIRHIIVDPGHPDRESVPPAAEPGPV